MPSCLTPILTKAPNLVILVTMPGNAIPSRKSFMVVIPSANRNSSISERGSRPGFSSSLIISFKVNNPTLSLTY